MSLADVDVVEAIEDWLASTLATSSASNPAGVDRARRADMCRWGRAHRAARGEPVTLGPKRAEGEAPPPPLDLTVDGPPVGAMLASTEGVLRALKALRSAGYAVATLRRMLASLRSFAGWCVECGLLEVDPTASNRVKVGSADLSGTGAGSDEAVFAFSAEHVAAIIDAAGRAPEPRERAWVPARDVAVLRVLADCGTRVSELCALRPGDVVEGDPPLLRLSRGTKRNKQRTVPVPARTMEAIGRWNVAREQMGLTTSPQLFCRVNGSALSQQFVDQLIHRCAARAGVRMTPGAASHAFGRHHLGVELAKRGAPVPVIQQVLGHADPRTTAIYWKMNGRDLAPLLDDAGWM